ncbi:hypothetical protein F0562_027877 [Nyssa sinensis]|uniref:Uncharacterized protein n=1 Tax=Nyssa sinensis TaxID=561372 RepID=A0A5J5B6W8_9ASTE|nr:hypothetical protein F0562_027877 [Nyssa sinensis]
MALEEKSDGRRIPFPMLTENEVRHRELEDGNSGRLEIVEQGLKLTDEESLRCEPLAIIVPSEGQERMEFLKENWRIQVLNWVLKKLKGVLEFGCENSQMCEELHKDGITEITCIDLSAVAVEKMLERLLSRDIKK